MSHSLQWTVNTIERNQFGKTQWTDYTLNKFLTFQFKAWKHLFLGNSGDDFLVTDDIDQ